ncbi:merozoite surface protein 7 [Plasmodium cynomolgi strain B]|uniref:Merozoite surface protein 7 n=1 Tax=Plasmodium cynomolgi (strain B) TaxID=1120755 RepID=K6UE46_PLACD|nr:merozoite surface protein 7 [Plasmodium cynomolgi strain B]GAB67716.1 merozoite surface protein 7 [Plasmodium cynomolgi strain B]
MKKTIVIFFFSFSFLISFRFVLSEKFGTHKKKNLDQEAMHALMKKLENLYRLSETDNSEVLNKEIESLKKQIDQLHQHGGVIEGENLGHLLESEAADESTKKTIFGMDEDDLDNYDADFTGQSKGKIKGQADADPSVKDPSSTASNVQSQAGSAQAIAAGVGGTNTQAVHTDGQSTMQEANQPAGPTPPGDATAQTERVREPNVKYLDKLYDEVLETPNSVNAIHTQPFHSKYNEFRKKYEFTMNEREYQIVKNLFDVCFKKEGEQSSTSCIVNMFKKVLDDKNFQKKFDNFVQGFYGFAKRHNYLRGERMANENLYKDILKNVVNLLNTIEVV